MADFANMGLAAAETTTVQILHPKTDEPMFDPVSKKPLQYTIYSPGSEAMRNVATAQLNKAIANRRRNVSGEQIEVNRIELLVAAISHFDDVEYEGITVGSDKQIIKEMITDSRF